MAREMALEIMPNQVHLFVKPHLSDLLPRVASQLKGASRRLRAKFPHLRSRPQPMWAWSYFTVTVGTVSAEAVRCIDTQNGRSWRKEWVR